jgi:magnesium-transporting ATPase (P-type)
MALKKALVRKLGSLEQLGNVSNICSDKTGTLTQGKMVATDMWLPAHVSHYFSITGHGTLRSLSLVPVRSIVCWARGLSAACMRALLSGFDPTEGFIVRKDRRFEDEDDDFTPEPQTAGSNGRQEDSSDIEMQPFSSSVRANPL